MASRKLSRLARASLKLTDGSPDQEFRGQHPLAESHLRMMKALEKHLHTGFAYLLFMDADGGERRIHQNSLFAIVEADQTDLLRHLHPAPAQRSPKSVSDFVLAGYHSSGSRPPRKDSSGAHPTEIDETQWISGSDQDGF